MRIPNWDVELAAWAAEQIGRPFIWGETDCVSLVCAGLSIVLGRPYFNAPKYATDAEARQYVPCNGRMAEQLALFGPSVALTKIQSADVLVLPAAGAEFCDGLGLVVGTNRVLIADLEDGVRSVRLATVLRAKPLGAFRLADDA